MSTRLGRRQVLSGLGLSLGATALVATASRPTYGQEAQTTLVIGAGLAGLTVARTLHDAGLPVLVLEARDRIGGRIHTSHLWPDLPMDLGASWIHGTTGNPLTDLARRAEARLVSTDYDAALLLGPDGAEIDPDLSHATKILRQALKRADTLDTDISVLEAVQGLTAWDRSDADQRRLVMYLLNSTLEQEYSGPARTLSAWHGETVQTYSGGDALFPGGFAQVTDHLARGLDILTSTEVATILPNGVRLRDGRMIAAKRVVCTLPLGVLQRGHIRFGDDLSPERTTAIDTLGMGLLNKCWLRFDRIAWPDDVDWIGWLGPRPGFWGEWVSLARAVRAPVLLGFNAADQASELEALSDKETVAEAHAALRAMFGSAFPAPVAAQVTRWGKDAHALGSYSFNRVGSGPETRASLFGSDWEGHLWFAGEATSTHHFGTAHGAVLSGLAIAEMILDRE